MAPTCELLALFEAEHHLCTKCQKKSTKYPEQVTGVFIFPNLNYFKCRSTKITI